MSKRLIIISALLTIFLDFFNLGLIYPIFSSLIFEGGLLSADTSEFSKNAIFGVLIAAFPFGQLFGAPVIGQISDYYGRRKLFIISLLGTVATLSLCALGVLWASLPLVLIGRLSGGLMAGNLALAYATIADFSTTEEKVRNFALMPFVMSLGFSLAPFLSGILANPETASWTGPAIPFLAAVAFTLVNLLLVVWKFPETQTNQTERKPLKNLFSGIANLLKVFQPIPVRPYLWILFLMISSNFLFIQFLGPFAIERFHVDVTQIGYLYTNIGIGAAIGNLFLTRRLSRHLSPEKALAWGLVALAILIVALILSPNMATLHVTAFLIMLACAVGYTNSMAIVSNQAEAGKSGEMMGLAVSIQNCSEFFPATVIGLIAGVSQNIPMLAASLCALLSYLILSPKLKTVN